MGSPRAVLFDLDGTFADTAPDLGHALNRQLASRGLAPLPIEIIRPRASAGARGLLHLGFGIAPGDAGFDAMRSEFLEHYAGRLCADTALFPGITELLDRLQARGIAWGIVTNKPERFTLPLMELLGFARRAGCIVSGDTTSHPKPHPAPLLHAARVLEVAPAECVYVGDDRRDMEAGLAAGMKVAVAGWGYLDGGAPERWGADWMLEAPADLLRHL